MRAAALDILDDLLGPVTKRASGLPSSELVLGGTGSRASKRADEDQIAREVISEMVQDWKEASTIVADIVVDYGSYKDCYINTETGEWFQPGTLYSGWDTALVKSS